jgi:hypothetical protein
LALLNVYFNLASFRIPLYGFVRAYGITDGTAAAVILVYTHNNRLLFNHSDISNPLLAQSTFSALEVLNDKTLSNIIFLEQT